MSKRIIEYYNRLIRYSDMANLIPNLRLVTLQQTITLYYSILRDMFYIRIPYAH